MNKWSFTYHYYKQSLSFKIGESLSILGRSGFRLFPYITNFQRIRNWNYPAKYNLLKLLKGD